MTAIVVHLSAEDGIGWLTPADELDEIELGERADWWMTNWMFALAYSSERDRIRAAITTLAGSVAEATSHRGLPFPAEWWPPSAGERADA